MTILDAVSRAAAEPDYQTGEDEQHSHQNATHAGDTTALWLPGLTTLAQSATAAAGAGRRAPRRPRRVSYVTNMGETRNPENPEPMTAAERMRRHRARQLGDDVPKVKPGPKPGKPQTLSRASLEELIDEVSDRLTGRMADDPEIRELAFRGVVHSYQTSGDRLSFVSIEPFAEE